MRFTITLQSSPDQFSFNFISDLTTQVDDVLMLAIPGKDDCLFNFSKIRFLQAEMSSVVLALIKQIKKENINVYLSGVSAPIASILSRNGFYELIWRKKNSKIESFDTVIKLFYGDSTDLETIKTYFANEVFNSSHWPKGTKNSKEQIEIVNSSLFEIAVNTKEHSQSKSIFMCGQFYPKNKQLNFAMVDNGMSIPTRVLQFRPELKGMQDCDLIDWSSKEGRTTKTNIASGLGLFTIKGDILHIGEMTIVSNNGYWSQSINGSISRQQLSAPFRGTMILFTFSLDENNYIGQKDDIINEDNQTFVF